MKKNILIVALSLGLVFLLASCSTGSSHTMDDGSNMDGAIHESSAEHTEWDFHAMEDGSSMAGKIHEESGSHAPGDVHTMEDGSAMEGAAHEEATESQ